LHYCAAFGLIQIVLSLVNQGADPLQLDKNGNTPLFWAVLNGHITIIKALLQFGGLNETNFIGDTPLHFAVKNDHLNIVTELVRNGAIVDIQNNDGYSPLHLAVIMGNSQIVEYLLKSGARADLLTIDGSTPIHLSTLIANAEILQIIVKQSIHYLFSQDEFGDTVVHWAVRNNDKSFLGMLLQLGAPAQTLNYDLETPMSLALSLNHLSLIPILTSPVYPQPNLTVDPCSNYLSIPSYQAPSIENWDINLEKINDFHPRRSDDFPYLCLACDDSLTSSIWNLTIG